MDCGDKYINNYCIKIDKFKPCQGIDGEPVKAEYKSYGFGAMDGFDLETFDGKDFYYIYGSNIEDLQNFIEHAELAYDVLFEYAFINEKMYFREFKENVFGKELKSENELLYVDNILISEFSEKNVYEISKNIFYDYKKDIMEKIHKMPVKELKKVLKDLGDHYYIKSGKKDYLKKQVIKDLNLDTNYPVNFFY